MKHGKRNICISALLALCMASIVGTAGAEQIRSLLDGGKIDTIMINGRIHTDQGVAEAIAIDKKGVIEAVGDSRDLLKRYEGKSINVIDLQGRTVLPGLHDLHVHPLFAGLSHNQCNFPQGSSLKKVQDTIARCVADAKPGEWIVGGQWDASSLGGTPNKAMLDKVAPDNPVALVATSGHSTWANSRALRKAGITKTTSDPKNGIIERDAQGNPTGVLRESAAGLVRSKIPAPTLEQRKGALKWALGKMLSYGITAFNDAAVDKAGAETYAALADEGEIKQRVRLCLRWNPNDPSTDATIAARNRYARDRVHPDCIKIFLDGVPTDSHTAAMLKPYGDKGTNRQGKDKGILNIPSKVLNQAVTRFDAMGMTVKFHAAGDAAVREGLDAIAAARAAHGFSGLHHNVGHCTFVAKKDIPRARKIGATFEVSPYLWDPSPINDSITQAVGDKRMQRVWPVREMLDSGALVVPGSDWSVVPSVNPWIAIETLVTREKPGGSKKSFGKAEAINLDEALKMFTVNSSEQRGNANKTGKIKPGMVADLIVIDRDPYKIPVTDLHKVVVLKTLVDGKVVYNKTH